MNRIFYWPLLFIVLFPVEGCHLIDVDDIIHHPDKIPQLCDVKKITSISPFWEHETIEDRFYYNKWGNPDSIISNVSNSGHPGRVLFRYDKQRRMSERLVAFRPTGSYFIWQKFTYDNKNRIIADSTYGFGEMVKDQPSPPTNTQYHMRNLYTYDAYDRIIKVVHTFGSFTDPSTFTYSYNSQGNLEGAVYDNKVNMHRTHKIWMFIDRNYSINNPVNNVPPSPADYNKYGLPVKPVDATLFLENNIHDAYVTYDCK